MTYHPPNAAAARNYVSRARKALAAGKTISPDAQAFLDAYGAPRGGGRPPQARTQPLPRPVPPPRAPEPAPPPRAPEASPEAPRAPERVTPPDMTVVDFGAPPDAAIVQAAPVHNCPPGCQHISHAHAAVQRCAINGEKQYPPMKPNASKGIARGAFFVTGFFIAIFKGLDEVPDPTPVEIEDGADAVMDIVATRYPQLGIYSDLLAGGYAISAYSIRTMNMPKEAKK